MFSSSSELRAGLRQQKKLSPAQTNRPNVTPIWRLNRMRSASPKDFGILCREGGITPEKERKRETPRKRLWQLIESVSK